MMPMLSYIICTAPRTGSTLLAEGLKVIGAGRPAEFFDIHAHNEQYWVRELGIRDDAEYADKIVEAGTTPNGVFGLKVHWHQLRALQQKLAAAHNGVAAGNPHASLEALIRGRFGEPRYIWLRRRNKIAQGISYYRAAKTGLWRSYQGNAGQPNALDQTLTFDFAAIDQHVRVVEEFDRCWELYFRQYRLKALIVVYERFVEGYEPTLRAVIDYLGLPQRDVPVAAPRLVRQADARSLEWEQRYAELCRARSAIAVPRPAPAAPAPARPKRAAAVARATSPGAEGAPLSLVAYALDPGESISLTAAPPAREWMDATPRRFAYRCLPMVIANQSGWLIRNPDKIMVTWTGAPEPEALTVQYLGAPPRVRHAASHFGSGVLTFTVGYLFRTPPGYNLYVRGPANLPKDGIAALEGIVETDWSEATFTMNWLVTRRNHPIVFEAGEPIAMVSPIRRGELERFRPEVRAIGDNPELQAGYAAWLRSRVKHNAGLKIPDSEARKRGWQRHYMRGTTVTEQAAPEHQTALALEPFIDKRK